MASVLHGSARTTPRLRAERKASKESSRALAAAYGLNPKTVAKWRGRAETADAPMGSKAARSTVLTATEEAIAVEFRRRTLLPLDDILGCLRTTNPIESVFATVRHRTVRTKGALSPTIAKLMIFKLVMAAAKTWRRLKGENLLPKVVAGVTFKDGTEVIDVPADRAA